MKSRIEYIIRDKNLSSAKFAEILGVQKSNISHILTGRNKPSLEIFIKILEKFPDINGDWLSFGKGNMYKSLEIAEKTSNSESFGNLFEKTTHNIEQKQSSTQVEEAPIYVSKSNKAIKKIIVYYTDNSYQEFDS